MVRRTLLTRARGRLSTRSDDEGPIYGTARLGRKTKRLVKRLTSSDIAIIDHTNIDRISAEDLIATGVRAVVNVSHSSDGSYPNAGPLLLVRAGVQLVDVPGAPLFEMLSDGARIVVDEGDVIQGERVIANGEVLEIEGLALQLEDQRQRIGEALEAFADNTAAHVRDEGDLLTGRLDFPEMEADFHDRHALIVVRGTTHRSDLRALRAYIRDVKPILIGVDGGADAIIEEGLKPHIVLGDMDSAGDAALSCGAELIVHAYPDGRAPGRQRLQQLGLPHKVVPAPGTSQDVAMLLAHEKGAELIVSVGAHFNLTEFLDKNRGGMSSTFLTRLRVGETLVDAKGVSRLYRPGVSPGLIGMFLAAALVLAATVVVASPALADLFDLVWLKLRVLLGL